MSINTIPMVVGYKNLVTEDLLETSGLFAATNRGFDALSVGA
jgi:hypothetical protein